MNSNSQYDLIVIGAGAAGLMAAGKAASLGKKVLLLEKNNSAGKKLRITGKGRCNISNKSSVQDFINHFGKNGKFLRQAFNNFFVDDLITFFRNLGIDFIVERGERIFPESQNANDIANALINWNLKTNVTILYNQKINDIEINKENKIFNIFRSNEDLVSSKYLIIATGGASYPATGSTGDGYTWARKFGHRIIPVRPALVPIETEGNITKKLQGLSLRNIEVSLWVDQKKVYKIFGELLFTHFGISGPVILTISKYIVDLIDQKRYPEIQIDLKPALSESVLKARLLNDINKNGKKKITSLLKGVLPSKLIPVCCELNNLFPEKLCNQVTVKERNRLQHWLKNFNLKVKSYRPLKEAIITAGGVYLNEINPRTMESKIIDNLFFAGEILDLDADTGGYNLQAAFSTGWIAGNSCI